MLAEIQRLLSELYDLDPTPDVQHFVCGRELLEATVGGDLEARGEVLLVSQDDDEVHVALYLAEEVLETLRADPEDFRSRCLATEGVSHFLYLSFRAENNEQVSQLELELQAEVDKYAAGLLAGNGVGAIRERSRLLRERLYARAEFIDPPDTVEGERYRTAHRIAARYAARLEATYVDAGRMSGLFAELRRFYRMGRAKKLEHVGM